jgi:hypothetical protein
MGVHGCGWKYLTLRLLNIKSYVKPFLVAKHTPQTPPNSHLWTSTMVKNIEYDIGAQSN